VRPLNEVWRFAFRVLAWIAPCFAAWYWIAAWYDRPAAWVARAMAGAWAGGSVEGIAFEGSLLTFLTTIEVRSASGETGLLSVDVNPLVYTYGAPLLAALLLASPRGWRMLVPGLALLVPFQAWGIAFDFAAQLLRAGPAVASQAALVGWKAEASALGYQLGSLMFPVMAPVVAWAFLQRGPLRALLVDRAVTRDRLQSE